MKWAHLRAFVWLRWRLLANQWRRSGILNGVLIGVLTVGVLMLAIPLFAGAILIGWDVIPDASPRQLMFAWDGMVVAFLVFWCVGLVTELQRSDPMLLSRFLHLPVSVREAYLINYLSSFVRLSLILFLATALGYEIALIGVKGPAMLPGLALLAAFVLMTTSITYQFQGFLAALMTNPRRRRSIIVAATISIVLLAQLPNLMNGFLQSRKSPTDDVRAKVERELAELQKNPPRNREEFPEFFRRQQEVINQGQIAIFQAEHGRMDRIERTILIANMILPIGWLPYGAMAAAEGKFLSWILPLAGMSLLAAASLARGYRKTIEQFQGRARSRPITAVEPAAEPIKAKRSPGSGILLVERSLPACGETVSAIATAGLRSLIRSPEARMSLLGPVFMIIVFGSMMLRGGKVPELLRPLAVVSTLTFMMLSALQMMGNQFGLDRDGFRLYVLSPARRRDILLGKNLVHAPLALAAIVVVLAFFQLFLPLAWDQFLAMIPLGISMFLVFCLFMNLFSILTPLRVELGSMKPSNLKVGVAFAQFGLYIVVMVVVVGLSLVPFVLEFGLKVTGGTWGLPIALLASIVECALIAVVFRFALEWEGAMLQDREQRILEIVTNRGS